CPAVRSSHTCRPRTVSSASPTASNSPARSSPADRSPPKSVRARMRPTGPVPTVGIVRHVRVEVARRASAWWIALAMTAAMLVAWPAVSPSRVQAAGVCGAQRACLVLADGEGPPAMWEEGTTRFTLVVDPPPVKETVVQLVYGPADGRDGRVD